MVLMTPAACVVAPRPTTEGGGHRIRRGALKPGSSSAVTGAGRSRPIALAGRVNCQVDARYGPVEVGSLLTTSSTPGHACGRSMSAARSVRSSASAGACGRGSPWSPSWWPCNRPSA
jgi:hypothetical protein